MDEIRDKIREALKKEGRSELWLSNALEMNDAYINQYLIGKQKRLPYEIRIKIAELLHMELKELGIAGRARPVPRPQGGLWEDAEPYVPPAGGLLAVVPHIAYFRVTSNALDQHPERIVPGRLVAFDLNRVDPDSIPSGSIVVAQCYDRAELLVHRGTIIRQFIAPNKLITNSSEHNEMLSLDDDSQPFVITIKGTMRAVLQDLV